MRAAQGPSTRRATSSIDSTLASPESLSSCGKSRRPTKLGGPEKAARWRGGSVTSARAASTTSARSSGSRSEAVKAPRTAVDLVSLSSMRRSAWLMRDTTTAMRMTPRRALANLELLSSRNNNCSCDMTSSFTSTVGRRQSTYHDIEKMALLLLLRSGDTTRAPSYRGTRIRRLTWISESSC